MISSSESNALRTKVGMTNRQLALEVVGPDGAGKSSMIEALFGQFENAGWIVVHWHQRPGLLRRKRSALDVSNPHDVVARTGVLAALKVVLAWSDFLLGHASLIRLRRRGDVVLLTERPFLDMCVDPARYRLPKSRWLRLIPVLDRALPSPTATIWLTGDSQLMRDRKPELTEEEVERQGGRWTTILPRARNVVLRIDTTATTVGESTDAIVEAIERLQGGLHGR